MSHSLGLGIPSDVLVMSSLVAAQSGTQEAGLAFLGGTNGFGFGAA